MQETDQINNYLPEYIDKLDLFQEHLGQEALPLQKHPLNLPCLIILDSYILQKFYNKTKKKQKIIPLDYLITTTCNGNNQKKS